MLELESVGNSPVSNNYNPGTGFSNSYSLEVEVEDCSAIKIDLPNGGYLGSNHIDPGEIDEDGDATVTDDRNREFQVHIDKEDSNDDYDGKKDDEHPN